MMMVIMSLSYHIIVIMMTMMIMLTMMILAGYQREHAMLCYAMLCYVTLCYATLCYAMLCYAMLAQATYEPQQLNGEPPINSALSSRSHNSSKGWWSSWWWSCWSCFHKLNVSTPLDICITDLVLLFRACFLTIRSSTDSLNQHDFQPQFDEMIHQL